MSTVSSITDVLKLLWTGISGTVNGMVKGQMIETYNLNSATKIDTAKCRGIYHNTENNYKLSAGMVKPIINADVSFVGEPVFYDDEDERINLILEDINKNNAGFFQAAHKISLREGDCYVWAQWDDRERAVKWILLPDDKLEEIIRDPVTQKIVQYVFKWIVNYKDKQLVDKTMTVEILIDSEVIVYKYTGDVPTGYDNIAVPNILKKIPVIQLSNEKEDFENKGHSEITALEPYLKAYHDVIMMALQSQKNNSAPKLKIKTSSFQRFIDANFGVGTFAKIQSGSQPEGVNIKNLDLLLLNDTDEAEYMTVSSTTGSAEPLLAILFYLIVETSETIEVVFGANLGTSLASVESQLPVYIKKVERKQKQFQKAWKDLLSITLQLMGVATIDNFDKADIRVEWPVVDFESAREKALTLQRQVSAYSNAVKGNLLSFEEVHEEVKSIFPGQEEDFEEHLDQISRTAILINKFAEDAMSQEIDVELTDEEAEQAQQEADEEAEEVVDGTE